MKRMERGRDKERGGRRGFKEQSRLSIWSKRSQKCCIELVSLKKKTFIKKKSARFKFVSEYIFNVPIITP